MKTYIVKAYNKGVLDSESVVTALTALQAINTVEAQHKIVNMNLSAGDKMVKVYWTGLTFEARELMMELS